MAETSPFAEIETTARACFSEFAGNTGRSWFAIPADEREGWFRVGAYVSDLVDNAYLDGQEGMGE